MKATILALLIAAAGAHAQNAQFFSGNKLLSMLQDESIVKQSMARGYIIGVVDTANDRVCVTSTTTVKQLADIVLFALNKLPEYRHEPADALIILALREAFPCRDGA